MPTAASQETKVAWEERIRLQKESGLPIERWCRENQISPHSFHYWKDRLFPKTVLNRSAFIELPDGKGTGITIEHQGIRIYLDRHFELETLKRCLAALKEISC